MFMAWMHGMVCLQTSQVDEPVANSAVRSAVSLVPLFIIMLLRLVYYIPFVRRFARCFPSSSLIYEKGLGIMA